MIWTAAEIDGVLTAAKAGVIVRIEPPGVDVATGCGVLRIIEAQPEGMKPLSGIALAEYFTPYHGRRFTY
jgi:methionyl-tRNA formyltransferase